MQNSNKDDKIEKVDELHQQSENNSQIDKNVKSKFKLICGLFVVGVVLFSLLIWKIINDYRPTERIIYTEVYSLSDGTDFIKEFVNFKQKNWNDANLDLNITKFKLRKIISKGRLLTQENDRQQETVSVQSEPIKGVIVKKTLDSKVEVFVNAQLIDSDLAERLLVEHTYSQIISMKDELVGVAEAETNLDLQGTLMDVRSFIYDTYSHQLVPLDKQPSANPLTKQKVRRLFFKKLFRGLGRVIAAPFKAIGKIFSPPKKSPPPPPPPQIITINHDSTTKTNTTTNILVPVNVTTPINVTVTVVEPPPNKIMDNVDYYTILRLLQFCSIKSVGDAPIFDCMMKPTNIANDTKINPAKQVIKITQTPATKK